MAVEIYTNQATTTVPSGGTTAPSAGTVETWTVASSTTFPAASSTANPPTQFHVTDTATGKTSEIILVTNVSGTTWTVTRGAESTTPVAHTTGFTIQQVLSTGGLKQARVTDWLNVKTMFGAKGDGSTDDTSAINTAIATAVAAGGGVIYFPAATYLISSALSVTGHNITLLGDGAGDEFGGCLTIISQTGTSANGLTCGDADNIIIQGIAFIGPGSGTGKGIALNYATPPTQFTGLTDVFVGSFGGDGVYAEEPILTQFTRVWSANNGGYGFNIAGDGTSCSFNSCWARNNSGGGWFVTGNYHSFSGCAADVNTGVGWTLSGCQSCNISGCGSELNTTNGMWLTASCYGVVISGLWVYNHGIGLLIDASCYRTTVMGFVEVAASGATYSIEIASGAIATLIQPQTSSALNILSGGSYVNQILDNGITLGGPITAAGGSMSAALAMSSNKVTGLANGTASTDAAAFGQLPAAAGSPGPSVAGLGMGLLAASPYACTATQIITGEYVFWCLCTAAQSVTVNTLGAWISTAGVTAGSGVNEMAIFSAAGTRLGVTGDMTTAFGSTGFAEGTLTGGVALTQGTSYYLAVSSNFTGTALQVYCQSASVAIPALNSHYLSVYDPSHATMPTSFTPSGVSLNKSALCMYAR